MKKLLATACWALFACVPLFSFANLTASQQRTVDTAASKIVTIMEKQNISVSEFIDILDLFENKLEGNEMKLMVLDALKHATLDAYYEVENFAMCESYSDGCNTCMIMDNYEIACTKRMCIWQGIPECLQYEGEDADEVSSLEEDCEQRGGEYIAEYSECVGVSEVACNELGGSFNECASACRHEPDGTICTMQCVQVCELDVRPPLEPVSRNETACIDNGGTYLPQYNECEGIDGLVCNSLGGTYNECASACRNEPEGSICTMQCVQVCDFNGGGDEEALLDAQMDLDAAMSLWNEKDLSSYTITQTLSCFCTEEYRRPIMYTVSNGVISSDGVYADGNQEMIDPNNTPDLLTVEGAFALIQDAIDQQAASITVEYNETRGYPMNIAIDYNEMMADEEKYYTFQIQ